MPVPITIPNLDPNQLLTNPARTMAGPVKFTAVTLDADFDGFGRWIYVGVSGNISIVQWDGTTAVFANVAAGLMHWMPAIKVNTSGTSASSLLWGG